MHDLVATDSPSEIHAFEQALANQLGGGEAVVFASGRMAFYAILKSWGVGPGDEVILPAFTCGVMANAILRVGAKPVFSDIDLRTLGTGPEGVEACITPRTKVIVAQHSFGIPCDIDSLRSLATRHHLKIIEDCSLTLDSKIDGQPVGTFADAAIFSFDHSKPLNALIGGAAFSKDPAVIRRIKSLFPSLSPLSSAHQRRLYDQLLKETRHGSPCKWPRILFFRRLSGIIRHRLCKAPPPIFLDGDFGLPSVSTPYPYPAALPPFLAHIACRELRRWPQERERRRDILEKTLHLLRSSSWQGFVPEAYSNPRLEIVPLRILSLVPREDPLRKRLGSLVDTDAFLFTEPIMPHSSTLQELGYSPGSCLQSEQACHTIVNLPAVLAEESKTFYLERLSMLCRTST
ncbi:MAG TPA: DegT/DnrJ/EryC1/StrS family aminotransferase [Candidatus Ozemobacteraceae bacterium]